MKKRVKGSAPPLCVIGAIWFGAPAQAQDHVVLGARVAVTPTYQGSDDYRVLPLPAIDIKKGWFFANLRNGIGIEPIGTGVISAGVSAVFVQGYRRRDIPTGISKLSGGLGARAHINLRSSGPTATLGVTKVISGGTGGIIADASVSYPILISSKFSLTPTVGATWADRAHNDQYFGVDKVEASASGLPPFSTGAGFKDISGTLTATYRLTDRIALSATSGVTTLLNKVSESALVRCATQSFGTVALTYRH
ncbi:MipA/OmpV family protein [Sphingobium sp. RAC03]|uniref:MipA/OmpV family protein n=1 Tax=Sphingobium sp. RAC03 TaxID=1843368 RepID=UPI00083D8004|nr:MipA/OmpV family protein [Sphingobium sp. RAC03]AOF96795.1 mltA-interacting MipA family protein [Sphingobium sp. RAC03]